MRRLQTMIVKTRGHFVKIWKITADKLSKAGWSWSCLVNRRFSQPGQSSSQTHIAATESVFLLRSDES